MELRIDSLIGKIFSLFKGKENGTVFRNIISLMILQGFNVIWPFILFPYLTRILGPEKYGLLSFATSLLSYFQLLSQYGFNLSGPREIAINQQDSQKVNAIFWSITLLTSILLLVGFIILLILVFTINFFSSNAAIYIITFGSIAGSQLLPVWFFQGIQNMKWITILNLFNQMIFIIFVFIYLIIRSIFPLMICAFSFVLIYKLFKIRPKKPNLTEIKFQFSKGLPFFIQQSVVSLYTITVPFILGLMTNNTTVGFFSVANTIVSTARGVLLGPIAQAVYPRMNKLAHDAPDEAKRFARKVLILMASLGLLLTLMIFFFAEFIINFLVGAEYEGSIPILRILSFIPFIVGISNVYGIQCLVPFGKQKQLTTILSIASGLCIGLLPLLIFFFDGIGSALAMVITESFVTVVLILYVQRNNSLKFLFTN